MLLVRTLVQESPIHGFGLFAAEPISAGAVIWSFDPRIDRLLTEAEVDALPPHVAEYLDHYCEHFPELGVMVLSGDGDRFTNHADDPNSAVEGDNAPDARVIAVRDIAAGEEITCDYGVIRSRKWRTLAETPVAAA